jgi:type IV secretion system protein VirB2
MIETLKRSPHGVAAFLIFSLLTLFPEQAHAAAAWEDALQQIVDLMTGTTARLLAILAVAGFGISAFFGKISWRRAGEIIVGIAIVFGAASIVEMFSAAP